MRNIKTILIKIIIVLMLLNIFLFAYIGWEYRDKLFLSAHFDQRQHEKSEDYFEDSEIDDEYANEFNLYKGKFNLIPSQSKIQGELQIIFLNRSDVELDKIVLSFYPDWLNPADSSYIKKICSNDKQLHFYNNEGIIQVILNDKLSAKQSVKLDILLDIDLPQSPGRIGCNASTIWMGNWIPYVVPVNNGQWIYHDFCDIGEPFFTEMAWYEMEINAPEGYTIIATGEDQTDEDNTFKTKVLARDFALWASSRTFKHSLQTDGHKTINLYSYTNIKDYKKVLETAHKALNYMEQKVGEYCHQELDIVATELNINGMEYSGVIFIDKDRLESYAPIDILIAHEVVHQWFYNAVGNDQYSQPWLDEAFATYMADQIIYGQVKAVSVNDKRPIASKIDEFATEQEYRAVVYTKGKYGIYQLREILGDKAFWKFLREYYNRFKYKQADNEAFFNLIDQMFGQDTGMQVRNIFLN